MCSKKRMSFRCDRVRRGRLADEAAGRNILLQKSDKEGLDDPVSAV